jgi:hypothetical protein
VRIASASLVSFFCQRTNGLTYCGAMIFRMCLSFFELALPIERTGRRFDADKARLQLAKNSQQLLAPEPAHQQWAFAADTEQLETFLATSIPST